MAAKTRRTYAGAAVSTTISAGINSTDTSITIAASTGWAAGPFYVVVDPGTSSEEKVYISSRSGTTLTVGTRGVDGTTAKSHSSGAVIYPVHTAIDSDEANELTAKYTTRGDIVYQGASTFERLAVGSADYVLKTNGTDPSWGQVGTDGIADDAITAAKIATGAVGATEIATGAVGSDEIATGAVGTDELASNAVTLAKLATAVQNFLVPVGTITAYAGATAPTGWLLCDGTSTSGYTTLASLVGATTPDLRGYTLVGKGSAPFDGALLSKFGSTTSTAAHTHSIAHDHAAFDTTDSPGSHSHTVTLDAVGDHSHPVTTDTLTAESTHGHGTGSQIMAGSGSTPSGTGSSSTGSAGGHNHTVSSVSSAGAHNHSINVPALTGDSGASSVGTAHGNVQPSALVNYIIKHD